MAKYERQKEYRAALYKTDLVFRAKVQAWNAASQKRRRATEDGWQKSELRRIKHRCKERDLEFNIDASDIGVPTVCPVLGIPLTLGAPPRSPGLPSIDRKIPTKGYIKGNVCVISWRANFLKNNSTSGDELRLVADYIDRSFLNG